MHKRETIYKVLDEELDYQNSLFGTEHDKQHNLWDFIQHMLIYVMKARNKCADNTFIKDMEAHDALREATALGIAAMQTVGYTRRYDKKETETKEASDGSDKTDTHTADT